MKDLVFVMLALLSLVLIVSRTTAEVADEIFPQAEFQPTQDFSLIVLHQCHLTFGRRSAKIWHSKLQTAMARRTIHGFRFAF